VRAVVIVLAFAMAAPPASAGVIGVVKDEARQYGRDFKAVVFAPAHWGRSEWGKAALTLGTIAVLMHEDEHIARTIQNHRNSQTNSIARAVTPMGGGRALQLSVAMIAVGLLSKNEGLRDTGRDSLEAELIAAGVITPVLKRTFGRARPNAVPQDAYNFHPFSSRDSFPSGHATNAFALASAVAGHSDGWVIPTVAYTVASGVAFARMNDNVHWASDVFAGAVIGTATGRTIARRHRAQRGQRADWTVLPIVTNRGAGFIVRISSR
jgi:membrane-associated phospholipid phosphatase